ncbi:MAG TPA: hypothetical protein ACFCUY_12650 [Xenococcaceae cyanobacterium]
MFYYSGVDVVASRLVMWGHPTPRKLGKGYTSCVRSGSWASLAFALGLGVPCCVWLPAGVSVPASWGLVSVGGGWWVSLPF